MLLLIASRISINGLTQYMEENIIPARLQIISDHERALKSLTPNTKLQPIYRFSDGGFRLYVHTFSSRSKGTPRYHPRCRPLIYIYDGDDGEAHPHTASTGAGPGWNCCMHSKTAPASVNKRRPLNILISCGHFQERDPYRTQARV